VARIASCPNGAFLSVHKDPFSFLCWLGTTTLIHDARYKGSVVILCSNLNICESTTLILYMLLSYVTLLLLSLEPFYQKIFNISSSTQVKKGKRHSRTRSAALYQTPRNVTLRRQWAVLTTAGQ